MVRKSRVPPPPANAADRFDVSTFPLALQLNQEFESIAEFKAAVQRWAVQARFTPRIQMSNQLSAVLVCGRSSECPFRTRVAWREPMKKFMVSVFQPVHSACLASAPPKRAPNGMHHFLLEAVPTFYTVTNDTSPKDLQQVVQQNIGQPLEYNAARKLLRALKHRDPEHEKQQFGLLPALFQVLQKKDQAGHFVMEVNDISPPLDVTVDSLEPSDWQSEWQVDTSTEPSTELPRFSRCFMCPSASKAAFPYQPKLVLLDVYSMQCNFPQKVLVASGLDANNETMMYAAGIVHEQSVENWGWFLRQLKTSLVGLDMSPVTLLGNAGDGLEEAIKMELPEAHYGIRCSYLADRIEKSFGVGCRDAFWELAKAHSAIVFAQRMAAFKEKEPLAANYLLRFDPKRYAAAFFSGSRFGQSSTTDEGLNEMSDACFQPHLECLMALWNAEARRRTSRQELTKHFPPSQRISPSAATLLDEALASYADCTVFENASGVAKVKVSNASADNREFLVDVGSKECSCRRFHDTGIPCTHAVAVLEGRKQKVVDYVPDYYSMNSYWRAYEAPMVEISMPEVDADKDNVSAFPFCRPPATKPPKGRPAKRKRPEH